MLDVLLVDDESQQRLPVGQVEQLERGRLVGRRQQALQLDRVQLEEVRQLELRRLSRLGVDLRDDLVVEGGDRGALVGSRAH